MASSLNARRQHPPSRLCSCGASLSPLSTFCRRDSRRLTRSPNSGRRISGLPKPCLARYNRSCSRISGSVGRFCADHDWPGFQVITDDGSTDSAEVIGVGEAVGGWWSGGGRSPPHGQAEPVCPSASVLDTEEKLVPNDVVASHGRAPAITLGSSIRPAEES